MGSAENPTHEWIELKNISGEAINLSGWQLLNQNERINFRFPQQAIFDKEVVLLARSGAAASLGADLSFTGAIRNENEGLRLFTNDCELVDEVFASPKWPAGDNGTKKTMVRLADLSWATKGAPAEKTELIVKTEPVAQKININTAAYEELQKLAGVGPVIARRIIDYREANGPFQKIEDIKMVSGIGNATFEKMKDEITI